MNKFYIELLDTLDQTGAAPGVQLAVLNLIEKQGAQQDQEPTQGTTATTKESILAITNPVERIRAIRDNPTLFGAANTHNELENKFQD